MTKSKEDRRRELVEEMMANIKRNQVPPPKPEPKSSEKTND